MRVVQAMGLNPLCGGRMRLGHIVHHAFELCDTHIATRPLVVSAATQLLELLHRPGALLEPPAKMSPCAPLAWRLQHARLTEFKHADARIQVLAVVLVGIVGMAREAPRLWAPSLPSASPAGARRRVPAELQAVLVLPHWSAAWSTTRRHGVNNVDAEDVHRRRAGA